MGGGSLSKTVRAWERRPAGLGPGERGKPAFDGNTGHLAREHGSMSEPLSIEDARDNFSELVESVTKRRERVTVRTPGGEEVVLMNAEDLESLEATLEILSDPEARESLERSRAEAAAGLAEPLEKHFPQNVTG